MNSIKLPGCETFTRPEEIAALSNFLGEVKNVQEKSIERGDYDVRLDPIPGETTGRIPEIESLPDYIDKIYGDDSGTDAEALNWRNIYDDYDKNFIRDRAKYSDELPENRNPDVEDLESHEKIDKIYGDDPDTDPEALNHINIYNEYDKDTIKQQMEYSEEIPEGGLRWQSGEVSKLPDEVDKIYGDDLGTDEEPGTDREAKLVDVESLPDYVDKLDEGEKKDSQVQQGMNEKPDRLENIPQNKLDNYIDKLSDVPENKLSDYIDTLKNIPEAKLSDYIDILKNIPENKLSDYIDTLKNIPENRLSDFIDILKNIPENRLSDYVEKLSGIPENKLSDFIEKLKNIPEAKLSDFIDILNDVPEVVQLGNYIDTLKNIPEAKLSDFIEKLKNIPEAKLSDFIEKLKNLPENKLSNFIEKLKNIPQAKLSDFIEKLNGIPEIKLDNFIEKLNGIPDNKLRDYIDRLTNIPELNLSDFIEKLNDIPEAELGEYIDTLNDIPEITALDEESVELVGDIPNNTLDNTVEPLGEIPDVPLSDEVITISPTEVDKLDDTVIKGIEPKEPELSDVIIGLTDDRETKLDETVQKIKWSNSKESATTKSFGSDKTQKLKVDKEITHLSDTVLAGEENQHEEVTELIDYLEIRPDNEIKPSADPKRTKESEAEQRFLENNVYSASYDPNNTADQARAKTAMEMSDGYDKSQDKYINPFNQLQELPEDDISTLGEVSDSVILRQALNRLRDLQEKINRSSGADRKRYENEAKKLISSLTESQTWNVIVKLLETGNGDTIKEWQKKVESELTTEFWSNADYKYVPDHQSKGNGLKFRGLAENLAGRGHGRARKQRMETILWGLLIARDLALDLAKSDKSNLPGNANSILRAGLESVQDGSVDKLVDKGISAATNVVKSGITALIGAPVEHPNPQNWPRAKAVSSGLLGAAVGINGIGEAVETRGFEEGNSRVETASVDGDKWGNALNAMKDSVLSTVGVNDIIDGKYKFLDNYVTNSLGVLTTLKDLCYNSSPSSLEDLYRILKSSPYITTPGKFTTAEIGRYKTQTLDQNAYWEIILEPFVDKNMNGGISYLPSFQEINEINLREHGVRTGYSSWLPIIGFELQKSKMNTKSLGLYDGEITYPISAEFTNEVRITIVDDIFKSFRRYFETCANVAIYNSEPHDEDYYTKVPELGEMYPTVIDKSNIVIALYKNITFRCRIYIMTPQYSTIRQYDLLLVMKDFSEEYTGEIDAAAPDLVVTFSIVGENPGIVSKQQITAFEVGQKDYSTVKAIEKQNKMATAIKNTISVIG